MDDSKAISPNEATVVWFKCEFESVYKVEDLGLALNYLGMEIEQGDGIRAEHIRGS